MTMTYKQVEKEIAKKEAEVNRLNKATITDEVEKNILDLYDELELLHIDLISLESERGVKSSQKPVVQVKRVKSKKKPGKLDWDYNSIIEDARRYKTLSEWNRNSYSSYSNAKKLGVFDQIKEELFNGKSSKNK